jgi:hypothetical protein
MMSNTVTPDAVRRMREMLEAELRHNTAHAGDVPHRMNPPLEIEEALDPAQDWPWQEPIHPR